MISEPLERETGSSELWATIFGPGGHPALKKQHRLHRLLPTKPRCRLCHVPFAGVGGWIMRRRGKAPSSRNPHFCSACDTFLDSFPGGAEVEMTVLYVDIRNSVAAAESTDAAAVSRRINTFLDRAIAIITKEDGFIMAFYGDCVVAVWPPGFSGADHASKAAKAARALCQAFPEGSGIPAGTGVHSGKVYIGTVAALKQTFRDISIFGHEVNVVARLASHAKAGKALISAAAIAETGENLALFPLTLKGIAAPIQVAHL